MEPEEEKSQYIEIPAYISEKFHDDNEEDCRILTAWVKFSNLNISDGDCLRVDPNGHRNDGKFFWDERRKQVIPFASDLDDYGCVPKEFDLRRFPLHFFSNVMDHNSFVRLDDSLIDQIVKHATFSTLSNETKPRVWSFFFLGKTRYLVLGEPSDCKYIEPQVKQEHNPGEWVVTTARGKYDVNSLEYAVNFMRVFIATVKDERIEYQNSQNGEMEERTLYVSC